MGNTSGASVEASGGTGAPARASRDERVALVISADVVAWTLALALATSFYGRSPFERQVLVLTCVAAVAQVVAGYATGLYRGRFRRLSFDEVGALAITVGIAGAVVVATEFVRWNEGRAGQSIVLATSVAVCLTAGHRYLRRVRAERIMAAKSAHRVPVIVYGAGEGGYRAVNAMLAFETSPYRPVAFIDDDPHKRHRRVGPVRVEGDSSFLGLVAKRYEARAVLLAIPSASGEELRRLHGVVQAADLETLVMPPVQRLVGRGSLREITRYTDEDVLHRKLVEIDPTAVHQLVSGVTVMVTGAGGSIGSELVRQLGTHSPALILAVDRDDSLLHHVIASLSVERRGSCVPVLADIRDIDRLDDIVSRHRPAVVFHAAALKHVPALEGAPSEAWKTNVVGTANVLSVCDRHDVATVVNISTDKAADPSNVLGYSKRIAEMLTASYARSNRRRFVSVRFGNVIGSRGSAIETFEQQIAEGGPVTVTHPDVTRYFMAVREAVRLTMQAAAIGRPGEALVLDMGEPVRVLDVARELVEQSGDDIDIIFSGLRPGEKMHEVLLGQGESADRPLHPMIDHVRVPAMTLTSALDSCAEAGVSPTTTEGLRLLSAARGRPKYAQSRHRIGESSPSVGLTDPGRRSR